MQRDGGAGPRVGGRVPENSDGTSGLKRTAVEGSNTTAQGSKMMSRGYGDQKKAQKASTTTHGCGR